MTRSRDQYGSQRVTVDVAVIAEHVARDGVVFVDREALADRHRSVIHWVHRQRHGDDVGVGGAVIGLVGEGVRTIEVGGWRVRERAVGVEDQRAVTRSRNQHGGQRITVNVAIVAEHVAR